MSRNISFAPGEWYHCFNRGVDKRRVFLEKTDYDRFLALLYYANSPNPVSLEHIGRGRTSPLFGQEKALSDDERLVDVGAFCLMPNHFHVIVREKEEGGLTSFMRKVGTGYTMYFNQKNERTGSLFGGKFKAKHITDDRYLKRVINYVHANPAELQEKKWKEGLIVNPKKISEFLENYTYSSLLGYLDPSVPLSKILSLSVINEMYEKIPGTSKILEEAIDFAKEESLVQ